MTTLLIAEHDNTSLKDATAKALTAAKALGAEVHVLVAGKDAKAAADAAAKLDGVAKVLLAESPAYEHQLAEPMAALIVSIAGSYDALVAPATTNGKNTMPRVAALLDVMQVSDVTKVVGPDMDDVARVVDRLHSTRRRAAFLPPDQRQWTTEWPDGWQPWW